MTLPPETILELSGMGLWELAPHGGRLAWSRTAALLHGRVAEHGTTLKHFLAGLEPSHRRAVTAALRTGSVVEGAVTFTYPWTVDGAVRWLRCHCVAARDHGNAGIRLAGTVHDVTADTLARQELVRAAEASVSASRVKSQFLANMSHEIRTPMNAVLGMMTLLLDTPLSAEQRQYAAAAQTSGGALLSIIDDILDLSKIEAGKLDFEERGIDVRAIVRDVLQTFEHKAREKGIELAATVAESLPVTSVGDPTRVRQVITNLVANALKFTARGSVRVVAEQEGEFLRISVTDTGIGLPESALSTIFQPFRQADGTTTRRFGGTGLGLSIVKQLVERMGGSIDVTSEVGVGSTFEVSMRAKPLVGGALAPSIDIATVLGECGPAATTPVQRRARHLHVLLAEDDDTNALLASTLLRKLGHTVERARSGAEAVDIAATTHFDVILMDVQMPELDGFEATAAIRGREALLGGRTPIIALTANAMKGDAEQCLARGMDDYLSKPIGKARLSERLSFWGAL